MLEVQCWEPGVTQAREKLRLRWIDTPWRDACWLPEDAS